MTDKSNCRAQQRPPPEVLALPVAMPQLIPVTSWNERHPWPPIGGLRHLIFFSKTNGFDKVVRRIGRRVLIDEAAFFAWAQTNGGRK